jgi:hypothetical protein
MDQLDQYLKGAKKSIFRYEGLQDYSAEDGEESVREYVATGKLPFKPEETEWWQDIKDKNENGVKTCRVRFVEEPLTEYTKMELACHRKSAAYSGEDIRIITSELSAGSEKNLKDFYLIDDSFLFLMDYGPKGKYIGSILVKDERVKKFIEYKNELISQSTSLDI